MPPITQERSAGNHTTTILTWSWSMMLLRQETGRIVRHVYTKKFVVNVDLNLSS